MKHARTDYDTRIQDSAGLIPDDEPVLLIRGQDQMAVTTIEFWIRGAHQLGVAPELIEAMERHRTRIIEWQADHGNKVPDAPAEAVRCDRLDLDEAIRAACLPNMRKAFDGEPVTARDIADEQAALDSIRGSMTESAVLYDRQRLVDVLIHHQPTSTSGCICGWGVLGASHPEHVVAVYEDNSLELDGGDR